MWFILIYCVIDIGFISIYGYICDNKLEIELNNLWIDILCLLLWIYFCKILIFEFWVVVSINDGILEVSFV